MFNQNNESVNFKIFPQDIPNEGLLFVNHKKNGRSGHNGHSLLEYKDRHILAFYLNGSADTGKGHNPYGWTEYKRSKDGGNTWGEPITLKYSKEVFNKPDYYSAYVKQSVVAANGTIIVLGCRFLKDYPEFDKAFYLRSYDEGNTWTDALDVGGSDDPVYGRPQASFVHDKNIFVLLTHGAVWGERHPHRLYVSTDNGESFNRRSDLTLDIDCWYGTMAILDNRSIIAYGYRSNDEHNLQYVISKDMGYTWSSPKTTYMEKRIRNPQLSGKIGYYYFMHGRSGQGGKEPRNLVLYSSNDAINWDSGVFLNKNPGVDSYSANTVIGKYNSYKPDELLIQSSIAYDGHYRVNIHHWWIKEIRKR